MQEEIGHREADEHDHGTARPGRAGPARTRVYEYVRQGILAGQLTAGSFLEEEEISRAVGTSRTPVREAFQQLHSERLIDLVPRRGAMVRGVTVRELLEIYETRLMIESHSARRLCAARHGAPAAMHETLLRMQGPETQSSWPHVPLNTQFHHALVAAAGNGVTTALYESLTSRQERVAAASVALDPTRRQTIHREHEALVAALDSHDAERAVAILAEHLRPVGGILAQLPA